MSTSSSDDLVWKESVTEEIYYIDLPGKWDNHPETKEKIWKTTKGEIFKITEKSEAILLGKAEDTQENNDNSKRKKIEIKI